MDLLTGRLTPSLIRFALPIALSSILQQLFNSADTLVIGRFGNSQALAAVGTNAEIVAFYVALSAGLAIGANVLAAYAVGSGHKEMLKNIHASAFWVATCGGILLAVVGILITDPVLRAIQTPAEILPEARLYLKLYLLGFPFLTLYDFGAALLRAEGDSARPFRILVFSGVLNVLLNLFFVIVLHMGVSGVAVATDIASIVSAAFVLGILWKKMRNPKGHLHVHADAVKKILGSGIPAALQGAVFCFANIFVQGAVNSFGATATAGSAISMNFEYIAYYMVTAFGQTATTFTSQSHAAGNDSRCRQTLRSCLILSIVFSAVITVPVTIFRVPISGLFSIDMGVIRISAARLLIILSLTEFCGLFEVPAGYLRGMGHSAIPAVETICGVCLFRIVWIFTVFRKFHSMQVLFWAFPASWGITSVVLLITLLWFKNHSEIASRKRPVRT